MQLRDVRLRAVPQTIWLSLAAFLSWGCPTIVIDEPRTTFCLDNGGRCTNPGEIRCSADSSSIERCDEDSKGCLRWFPETRCSALQSCRDDGIAPLCICLDECVIVGERRCHADVLQSCAVDENGCHGFLTVTDCISEGRLCSNGDDGPACRRLCDECSSEGTGRCHDNAIERCNLDHEGCLRWIQAVDCDEGGGICDDSRSVPFCSCVGIMFE